MFTAITFFALRITALALVLILILVLQIIFLFKFFIYFIDDILEKIKIVLKRKDS